MMTRTTMTMWLGSIGAAVLLWALPMAISAQERVELIVSSRNSDAVLRYDGRTGAFLGELVPPGGGGLSATQEVLPGPSGGLLVSGRGNDAILMFSLPDGRPLATFTRGYELDNPTKMTWGPGGHLYVSQWGEVKSSVAVFDEQGDFVREATPNLNQPQQHLWDDDGLLYVVSFGSRDVRRFRNGEQVDIFIPAGPILEGPVNLWWDDDGSLLVADWQSGSVQRFDGETGEHLGAFIENVANPEGFAIGPDSGLYLGEWSANRIARFDAETGERSGVFAEGGGLLAPNSLLFVYLGRSEPGGR